MDALRLDEKDYLSVDLYNSVSGLTVNISARVLNGAGQIIEHRLTVVPVADRTEVNADIPLGGGTLVSLSVHPSGATVHRGEAFIYAFLNRDSVDRTFPGVVLMSDYLVSGSGLGWPGGVLRSSVEGPGVIHAISTTNPGFGDEVGETVPVGSRWRVLSFTFGFTTSAVAANRQVRLCFNFGIDCYYRHTSPTVQPASKTFFYVGANTGFEHGERALNVLLSTPDIILPAGFTIKTETANLDPGDNYFSPKMVIEEWIEV